MQRQTVNLNDPNALEQIMRQTNQQWRKCRRKSYEIHAYKMPSGYVFANKLEQPASYSAIHKLGGNKYIVKKEKVDANPTICNILKQNGAYVTDGKCVTLCGTVGELWTVKEEKLRSAYTLANGSPIREIPDGWFTVSRAAEAMPSAVGICIPKNIIGMYKTSWGQLLTVNNPQSKGHGVGDIFVVPVVNGQLDFADCSPVNNEVFANTFDLTVGGWSSYGIKASVGGYFTYEDCNRVYPVLEGLNEDQKMKAISDPSSPYYVKVTDVPSVLEFTKSGKAIGKSKKQGK